MLWCTAGKHRSWANKWKYACGILWQDCEVHSVDPMQHQGPHIATGKPRDEDKSKPQLPKHCSQVVETNAMQHGNVGKVYKRKCGVHSDAPQLRGGNFDSIASDPKCPRLAAKIAAFKQLREAA